MEQSKSLKLRNEEKYLMEWVNRQVEKESKQLFESILSLQLYQIIFPKWQKKFLDKK